MAPVDSIMSTASHPSTLSRSSSAWAASFPSPRGTHRRWVARLVYRLPKPAPDGRTELLLSPLQLLERLARLVPPPRVHRHRYHGVLARGTRRRWVAKLRAAVTYIGRPEAETTGAQLPTPSPQPSIDAEPARITNPARIRWAVLLARIYEVLPLLCPACGGQMKILAFVTDPPVVTSCTSSCPTNLHSSPPPAAHPKETFWIRLRPSIPTEAEPVPDFVFDQSLPDEFDD